MWQKLAVPARERSSVSRAERVFLRWRLQRSGASELCTLFSSQAVGCAHILPSHSYFWPEGGEQSWTEAAPLQEADNFSRMVATASLSFVLSVAFSLGRLELKGRERLCLLILGADCEVRASS